MKQSTLTAPYTIAYTQAPTPAFGDDEVLLQVRQIGICGSDIQMYHGLHKFMTYPVTIGHEAAAEIVAVGKNVVGFKTGDLVTVEPQITCGACYPCKIGHFNVCEHLKVLGVHENGFACEYVALSPRYLHLCNGLSIDQATLMEPLAVGIGSAKRAGDLHGKNVVVVGAGTIGNLAAQSAKALGAGRVMVVDTAQNKLDYARDCGIPLCVNIAGKSLKDVIVEMFGLQKADVIIDCAGTSGSLLSILDAARPASSIVITANFKTAVEIFLPVMQRQEISLLGHMMYVREDFQDAIRFVADGSIVLDGFVTRHFDFDRLNDAFKFIDENPGASMKVAVRIG